MISRSGIVIVTVALLSGIGSYLATVTTGQRSETRPAGRAEDRGLARWLALSPEQQREVEAADPTFSADCRRLREESNSARDALASALTDDSSSDEDILAKTEAAIKAHGQLERRVAEHLLKVRTIVTPEQRRRLFELSAEQVRQGRGHGYGGPPEGRGGGGRGRGQGRGPGGGGARGGPAAVRPLLRWCKAIRPSIHFSCRP